MKKVLSMFFFLGAVLFPAKNMSCYGYQPQYFDQKGYMEAQLSRARPNDLDTINSAMFAVIDTEAKQVINPIDARFYKQTLADLARTSKQNDPKYISAKQAEAAEILEVLSDFMNNYYACFWADQKYYHFEALIAELKIVAISQFAFNESFMLLCKIASMLGKNIYNSEEVEFLKALHDFIEDTFIERTRFEKASQATLDALQALWNVLPSAEDVKSVVESVGEGLKYVGESVGEGLKCVRESVVELAAQSFHQPEEQTYRSFTSQPHMHCKTQTAATRNSNSIRYTDACRESSWHFKTQYQSAPAPTPAPQTSYQIPDAVLTPPNPIRARALDMNWIYERLGCEAPYQYPPTQNPQSHTYTQPQATVYHVPPVRQAASTTLRDAIPTSWDEVNADYWAERPLESRESFHTTLTRARSQDSIGTTPNLRKSVSYVSNASNTTRY